MKISQPTIIIIVGISGNLSLNKLLPALAKIALSGKLPQEYRIIGITRQADLDLSKLLVNVDQPEIIRKNIELLKMDLTSLSDYQNLANHLKELEKKFGASAQRLFYLSVPPEISRPIIELLGTSGLAAIPHTKLLLEKPFGVDLESAKNLVEYIDLYFKTEQIYRIDHYLAKEMAQNIIIFRHNNSLFKRTWNRDFIEKIEITATEKIGIEGRTTFYQQTGALRDLVQSHLLQLAALTLMRIPDLDNFTNIPAHRFDALKDLHLPSGLISDHVKRGQYADYRSEVNDPHSLTETFVSLTLESDNPQWKGVPIKLTTGKALNEKSTTIKIFYRKDKNNEANQLTLYLQPNEGVELCLFAKRPGYDHQVERHPLKFAFREYYQDMPEAYEQVLFDAINYNHTLFTTSDEVLASWRIIDPIQNAWKTQTDDLIIYKSGSSLAEILDNK